MTYPVRAAVSAEVGGKCDSSTETEEHAQSIHDHVDDGNGELVDECCGKEVQQCEQPPYTDEQCVVDNRVCAVGRTCDIVAGHSCNDHSAEELYVVNHVRHGGGEIHIPGRREGPYPILATPF